MCFLISSFSISNTKKPNSESCPAKISTNVLYRMARGTGLRLLIDSLEVLSGQTEPRGGEQRATGARGSREGEARPGLPARLQLHRRPRSPAARRDPGIFPLKRSPPLFPEASPPAFLPRTGCGSALVLRAEAPAGHRAFRVRSLQPCACSHPRLGTC